MNKIIKIDVFDREIMVHFGSRADLRRKLSKYFGEEDAESIAGRIKDGVNGTSLRFEDNTMLLWMPDKPQNADEFGTLSHEIFHITDYIAGSIDVRLSESSDEVYAYLIGYLTKTIIKEFSISIH